ncbi:hypothetical protein DVH24_009288 [Malus domestica]|uniref:Uncharacterized protein n=1 Tax=Malus domestica TaxID=3750 RepID=A0A498ITL6_MALDO|nr:hypothetical protein DVH24_009288 [Malus domestica]
MVFLWANDIRVSCPVRPRTISNPHVRCLVCLTESSHLHHPVSNLACLNHRATIFSNHLHSFLPCRARLTELASTSACWQTHDMYIHAFDGGVGKLDPLVCSTHHSGLGCMTRNFYV